MSVSVVPPTLRLPAKVPRAMVFPSASTATSVIACEALSPKSSAHSAQSCPSQSSSAGFAQVSCCGVTSPVHAPGLCPSPAQVWTAALQLPTSFVPAGPV
jgi:hypothetical protein